MKGGPWELFSHITTWWVLTSYLPSHIVLFWRCSEHDDEWISVFDWWCQWLPHLSGQVQFYTDNRIEKFSLDLTIQRPLKAEKFSGWRARSAPSPRKSIERRKMEKMMWKKIIWSFKTDNLSTRSRRKRSSSQGNDTTLTVAAVESGYHGARS